ncbi:hypothetical protein QJQ45_021938 [Haematococcus lacustris]|nr:hypothetical protein QJQ45_021938 [Haematococcus lacustris]
MAYPSFSCGSAEQEPKHHIPFLPIVPASTPREQAQLPTTTSQHLLTSLLLDMPRVPKHTRANRANGAKTQARHEAAKSMEQLTAAHATLTAAHAALNADLLSSQEQYSQLREWHRSLLVSAGQRDQQWELDLLGFMQQVTQLEEAFLQQLQGTQAQLTDTAAALEAAQKDLAAARTELAHTKQQLTTTNIKLEQLRAQVAAANKGFSKDHKDKWNLLMRSRVSLPSLRGILSSQGTKQATQPACHPATQSTCLASPRNQEHTLEGDSDLLLRIAVVAVVGQTYLMPELLWASKDDGLHAFELYRHIQQVCKGLQQPWGNNAQLLSQLHNKLQQLVPIDQQEQQKQQLATYLQQHCAAMEDYYRQHCKRQLDMPHLMAALGGSDPQSCKEVAAMVVQCAALRMDEGQSDLGVWDPHSTWRQFQQDIRAMAEGSPCSTGLRLHLEVYFLACPTSNAPVESLLQLLKHGAGRFMELPALLEHMSLHTHRSTLNNIDVQDFTLQLPKLRAAVREHEVAGAVARAPATAARKATAAACSVGVVVVNVGDLASQQRVAAAATIAGCNRVVPAGVPPPQPHPPSQPPPQQPPQQQGWSSWGKGPPASPDFGHMYQLALAAIATEGQAAMAQAPAPGRTLRKRDPTENHVQAALAQLANTYRDQIHQLDDEDSALAIAQARVRMQQLISTQPKKANKRILRPSRTDHKGLQALADPDTKTICTAPADLNRIITTAYGQKLSAPTPKTGHYTNTQTRNYPWARAKADDAFSIHACQNIHWLHTAIMDKAGFQECISRLAGGKAPGPDGVENEIIKMLPWEMRETIHQLFIIMWATGGTPTTWKTSDTCLLYKDKGQETDLNSYRPVGLANTVYKLWTSLITKTLSEYAEANGMLSKNQAGFRSHRNTTQQLQMLVMALEDAKLAKADIYALLVDFTSAFNTTCQDKLLWIMHDLGFPTDATDAVKDLYTGATTRFKTPYGHTDPVSVNRGTIQGDSLSPFLFLIYIEPLLRWLQAGARGYKFKSATADSGERATVSSIDYADDIAILCNTLRNLRCQADKLSAFSDWGHLIISHSKTLATAALHHSVETGMCSNAAEADKRARQQLQTVSLQGKPVTYHRPTSPFTYLGVLITMTLDWKPQHTAMITQLRQKLERLRRSFASARQAIHIIRTAIIPSLAYSFCAVPCTPGDLELYDRSINQCVKLKLRLPLGTPNAIIREDAEKLGMGISSTAQEYHARNTTALIHSLQSTDVAHAHISRSMLHKQITWLSTQASTQGHRMLTLLHHTLRARQLVYASISGLSATEEGLPLYHEECQTLGRLITQASSSQAHDVVSASITCLKSLGITHASELSCKGNTHIITGSMLTSKYGKKVKQKHIIALNKLAAMAAQPSCPDATATRAIRDSRNTSLDLPPDQRKITTWAAGLTELAPTPAVPDTRTRYMDMKAYAVKHATQPATADRTAAAPAAHEAIRTSSRLLKREQRATQSAPTKPTPPKAGTKRNNEGRQTQTIPQDIVRIVGLDLPGLSSWKVDKACRCKPKNLGCILGAMYGHQEAITSIDGWQWDGINKENYYKVHWKPTVIDRWALPLCAEEGYTPTHIETISREEAKDVCTCELCWLPKGDSPMCHSCKRAYHPACLEEAHLSGHKEPGYWLCPICKFGSNDFKTTMRQSAHSDLIRVHWHPTLEPAPLITAHLDYIAKRNDYDEENRQIQEARHARPDTHLPAHTRQGLPDPHTWLPRCTNLHSKATFHTYPINPQTDIVGTGNCETFLQLHPHMTAPAMSLSTGEPIMPRHDLVQHVTVHDESGRTVGLLTKDQHQHLHAWLQHTPHTRNLATEVVALLRRQDAQSSHHPMRGAQDKALNTLLATRSFPSTVQRWADPLTVRPETTTYWSPDTNDTAFGAHHNCLLVRHTGLSTWNVPADDAVALKCVNHAIHSATQEEAMATIMLIPGKKGISYPKHIDTLRRYPEYCQHLANIPPTKTRSSKSGKHANLHIYVIWNAAGQQLVTKGNPQGWLASTATALHPQRDTHPIRNRPTNQSQPATPPSGHKQHMRLPLDKDLPTSGHQRGHQQLTHHSTTQPRMAITEWATIAYTDGSCIKTSGAAPESVGAGVYFPENNVLITAALNDPESKTINRAELTAIHAALKAGAKRIATDSLCSLYQIRRALANPMSLITHRHNDILADIATLIIDSPATIHFYKVRAHSGIIGNEGADALAKFAALHPELANTPAYSPTTRNETKNWLSNAADGDLPAPLPDCRHSVRAHMHRKHKLGLANQDSIYYQMTQEITKAAAKGAGERVIIDTNISTHAQRTALLYRTGGLYNQKLAMRWKRATDDRCPLCGNADSATHLLSGCSETLPMVQERHNGAGRLITKAISKGTLGGYISFADTGSWEKGAKESLDLPSDTLHTTLLTLGLKPEDTKHTTRPDILMVAPHKKASKDGKDTKRVCIIEIKYCSDSRWTDQLNKALTQHTHLAETIRKEDHMVAIIPILLGIGGITYEAHTRQHLLALGITQANTTKLLNNELKSQLLAKEAERKRITSPEDSPRQKQRGAAEVHVEELDDLDVKLRQHLQQLSHALQLVKGCDNSGREQLDAQGWDVQQAGLREGAAGQGQQAPGTKLHDPASDVIQQRWREPKHLMSRAGVFGLEQGVELGQRLQQLRQAQEPATAAPQLRLQIRSAWSGHQHGSSGRHLLSPMSCMFNAALQTLSSHLPGCGACLEFYCCIAVPVQPIAWQRCRPGFGSVALAFACALVGLGGLSCLLSLGALSALGWRGSALALALRLLAVWLPGCMGLRQDAGLRGGHNWAPHQAPHWLVTLLAPCYCWLFTAELTRLVRNSSTGTTLPYRWAVPLGLHTTLQQARSTASAPQPPLVPMPAAPRKTTSCSTRSWRSMDTSATSSSCSHAHEAHRVADIVAPG